MPELWEAQFASKRLMWGEAPTRSALLARDFFVARGARDVLIPGVGYGRNAKPFLERGLQVTGIEISESAIAQARSELGLTFPIHHGAVGAMPFDDAQYDAVFAYGLAYLLDAAGRAKFYADCFHLLRPGGAMWFTLISKTAPMYGQGPKLGEDWYERAPGLPMFFYGRESVQRELGAYGITEVSEIDEPVHGGSYPFLNVVCVKTKPERD
ncbi:MAG: class I SAM-dependent methyltransferase [Archangiaceae bacterium]|nr:class I SAM-dependent methyltransferase [Archangiaceae bacterium]